MSKRFYLRIGITVISVGFIFFPSGCKTRAKVTAAKPPVVKTMDSVQGLLDSLEKNSFRPRWMSAKASVTTIQEGNETSFNISLRYKKDSVIWVSISPLLGIEVARVMVTPDSVKLLDRLHGNYQSSSFDAINKLLQMKVDFSIVQSILLGNFFAYKKSETKFNSVFLEDKYYILSSLTKHKLKRSLEEKDPNKAVIEDVYVNESNFRVMRLQVEDQKINKTLNTEYSDFRNTDAGLFPFKSSTKITAEKNFEIQIEFGKVTVGETQEFPFNIPDSYERIH